MPFPEEQIVTQRMAEPVHITLTRNAKGDIQWEVSIHGPTTKEAVDNTLEMAERAAAYLNEKHPKGGEVK